MGYFFCMPTLPKYERLCGEIAVNLLFSQSKRFTAYPLRVHYALRPDNKNARFMVSIPKKLFKHAVDRNLLKRRIREAYRKYKPTLSIDIAFVYMDKEIGNAATIEKAVKKAIDKITLTHSPNN